MEIAIRFQLLIVTAVKITCANIFTPSKFTALLYTASETPFFEIFVISSASFKMALSSSVKKGVSHHALMANNLCVVSPRISASFVCVLIQ